MVNYEADITFISPHSYCVRYCPSCLDYWETEFGLGVGRVWTCFHGYSTSRCGKEVRLYNSHAYPYMYKFYFQESLNIKLFYYLLQGTWWYRSIKYSAEQILMDTTQIYFYFFHKTPNMMLKSKYFYTAKSVNHIHLEWYMYVHVVVSGWILLLFIYFRSADDIGRIYGIRKKP